MVIHEVFVIVLAIEMINKALKIGLRNDFSVLVAVCACGLGFFYSVFNFVGLLFEIFYIVNQQVLF